MVEVGGHGRCRWLVVVVVMTAIVTLPVVGSGHHHHRRRRCPRALTCLGGLRVQGLRGWAETWRTEVQDKMKTKELTNAGLINKIPSQHRRAPDLQGTMLDVRDVDRRALRPLRWHAFVASECGSTVGARGVVVAGTSQYRSARTREDTELTRVFKPAP